MKNIPTDLLRTYVTVCELGGFTAAGELIGRSQPAVSLQVKRLEELLAQSLLRRGTSGLEPTAAGRTLLDYARQILALNDQVVSQLSHSSLSGKIRFGIPSEFATTLMPKILGRFSKAYPNVSLEVNCALSKELLSQDERHQYDLILALYDDLSTHDHSLIMEDELIWVGGPAEVTIDQPIPLVVAPRGCIYRKRGIERLRASGQPWRIAYTNPDLSGIETAIGEGLGFTVLARSALPEGLRPYKGTGNLPALGKIGISLIKQGDNDALNRLSEFVKASL